MFSRTFVIFTILASTTTSTQASNLENVLSTSLAFRQSGIIINQIMGKVGTNKMFSCDPIFNSNGALLSAMWYKDGVEIGEITNEENLIYENRTVALEKVPPKVGFLIISNLQPTDEGDYWCIRKDTGVLGEISRIRLAFMTLVPTDIVLVSRPEKPIAGETVEIECVSTTAFPVPAVTWLFNGKSLPMDSKHDVATNASLLIYNYSTSDAGTYTCILTNFAGFTNASVTLVAPEHQPETPAIASAWSVDYNAVKSGTTWFVLGCGCTFGLICLYLFSGMIFYRVQNRRPVSGNPPLWQSLLHADPVLAPGFRKPIAPIPENPLHFANHNNQEV